jgi:predicted enzyme related to lactoylglutathione lyase
MRLMNTVIYTDKVNEVRAFYEKHFAFQADETQTNAYSVFTFGECAITYIVPDSGQPFTQNAVLRIRIPFTEVERARLIAEGASCGELIVEQWGDLVGGNVRYFTVTDPSGTQLQIFEDGFGAKKQLMTTADGTETRKVHQ